MPLALPVHERILAVMATRAASCTTANGYEYNVATVMRRTFGDVNPYPGNTVEIMCDGFQRLDALDEGQYGRVMYEMRVFVLCYIEVEADEDGGPGDSTETMQSRAERDMHKALGVADRFGLADIVELESVDRFDPVELAACGTLLAYRVQFLMDESDLAIGRV